MLTDDQYAWIVQQIEKHRWQFAKTLPENPHFYTKRKEWDNDDDFVEMVMMIRENGHQVFFAYKPYIVLDVDGYRYWTQGSILEKTILINRRELTERDREIEPQYVNPAHQKRMT